MMDRDFDKFLEQFEVYMRINRGYTFWDGFPPEAVIDLMREFFDGSGYMLVAPMTQEDFENDRYA